MQSVCDLTKRKTPPRAYSGEIFKNGWLWMTASEQSEIAACNIIRFLATPNVSIEFQKNLYSLQNKHDHKVLRDSHPNTFQ